VTPRWIAFDVDSYLIRVQLEINRFTLDCCHLVEPLETVPCVILGNWLIQSVAYDRARMILELEMNTGERFQYVGVPRRVAIGLVRLLGRPGTAIPHVR
jgi:hypothetical protein